MIEGIKRILILEVRRRNLSTVQLAGLSGLGVRTVACALSTQGENAVVSIWVYEELYHTLGIRLQRKVQE